MVRFNIKAVPSLLALPLSPTPTHPIPLYLTLFRSRFALEQALLGFLPQNNNIHSSSIVTPWTKQACLPSNVESPIMAPRQRLETVESAAKFLTETSPNNITGSCKIRLWPECSATGMGQFPLCKLKWALLRTSVTACTTDKNTFYNPFEIFYVKMEI